MTWTPRTWANGDTLDQTAANDLETRIGNAVTQAIALLANQGITLTASGNAGTITPLIRLVSTGTGDRPWITFIYQGRTYCAFGWHHTDQASGNIHKRWEVKTVGTSPSTEQRSRLAIGSDADLTDAIFNYLNRLQVKLTSAISGDEDESGADALNLDPTTGNARLHGTLTQADPFPSGHVRTMPPEDAISNLSGTTSGYWAAKTIAPRTGTYTGIRTSTGSSAPSAVTDLRLTVNNPTNGTVLQQTANLSAQATGANVIVGGTANLGASVTVNAGDTIMLGVAWQATTGTFRGKATSSTLMALTNRTASGSYSGGTAGNATGQPTGNLPWIELVP